MKERPDVGVYIKDLSGYVVNNADDMDRIMTLGHKNRKDHLHVFGCTFYKQQLKLDAEPGLLYRSYGYHIFSNVAFIYLFQITGLIEFN